MLHCFCWLLLLCIIIIIMIQLITHSIKYLIILLCCLYTYKKLASIKLKPIHFLFLPVFAIFAVGLNYVWVYARIALPICLLIISTACFFIGFRRPLANTLSLSVVALGITILLMAISSIIALILMIPAYYVLPEKYNDLVMVIIFSICIIPFTICIFKIKRFKNGISPIKNDETFERLILASTVCIFGMMLVYSTKMQETYFELALIFIAFCCLSLIIWWRKLVTTNYKKHVLKRNVDILQNSITECENEREKLEKQNNELAKIIHRDNKLLPSMQLAVKTICEKYPHDSQAAELLKSLDELYSERADAVENFQNDVKDIPRTGNITVDGILRFLLKRAGDEGVDFSVETDSGTILRLTEKFTDITDLNTVLCDLGENAVLAVKNVAGGKVKIAFVTENDCPCIKFFDNGAQFDEKVISEMGRVKITTRKSDGGSGIGLESTFSILKTYSASLCIDELCEEEGFTKCLIFCLDGKCMHSIKTNRESVKKICNARSDFYSV